ncbi:spore coat protein CotJB [Clostridiaceae bacterium]|nr:spore coat protein CotJB [Clostridiaceae bacterium]RKI11850.1 spore coat protein CotJB [bacterium 1XD21-70]
MTCGNALLQKVYETGFALDEVNLYLDTHPADSQAMEYYQYIQKANQDAVAAYEQSYGPLMANQVDANTWNWINSPWPWEGGM